MKAKCPSRLNKAFDSTTTACISDLGISPNLATYMRMANDPFNIISNLISPEMSNNLRAEYEQVKKNQTVEQLYEQIALK